MDDFDATQLIDELTAVIRNELSILITAVSSLEAAALKTGAFQLAKFQTGFAKCEDELSVLRDKIADIESGISVYKELADKRKAENASLQKTIDGLTADIALLLSALENGGEQ